MNTFRQRRWLRVLAALFAVLLVAGACDSDDDEAADNGEAPAADDDGPADDAADDGETGGEIVATIAADDQDSDGSSMTVASASIEGSPGWVVIHADGGGAPGEVLGQAPIPEGESTDVVVEFDEPLETATYWPMIHIDAGVEGEYEFPGDDVPAMTAGGEVAVLSIEVTVA